MLRTKSSPIKGKQGSEPSKKRLSFAGNSAGSSPNMHVRRQSQVKGTATPSAKDAYEKSQSMEQGEPEWYSELSEDQLKKFRTVYDLLDKDGDHTLITDEVFELLKNLDVTLSKEEIGGVLKQLDSDGEGVIDYMEFLYAMAMSDKHEDEEVTDKQNSKRKYSRRQSLFFTSITDFAVRTSLCEIERYYRDNARYAPHVLTHYTACERLLVLTDKQVKQRYDEIARKNFTTVRLTPSRSILLI